MWSEEVLQRWAASLGFNSPAILSVRWGDGRIWAALVGLTVLAFFAERKFMASLLTLRARALAPTLSRYLSRLVKSHDYSDDEFFCADGAGEPWVQLRKRALARLSGFFQSHAAKSIAWGNDIRNSFSDLRFTDANRVPFPFARLMREKFNLCSVVSASDGPRLRDLDGNWTLDVSGSYGLNVAGFDRYKEWMQKGWERVKDLGPVLGPLHPVVADNIGRLKTVSKMDEVSFHMSGTEAVMAAVRLARFNTRRQLIVCFSGAYHGWWDGVQPGLGSERAIGDCLTLKDMHPASLELIRRRAKDIAGVLLNPFQSFHPNSPPPSDTVLLMSGVRKTEESSTSYAQWLKQLRGICSDCNIPLIFDEVYTGFRLAPGGAQEYFGVAADIVVYGKTVAGGMPIGVVCGKAHLMRRFDHRHPMRIAYVIGTFSAHPLVMGAMNEFLRWLAEPTTPRVYAEAEERCDQWARETNQRLAESILPIRVVHMSTVWTVLFRQPSRYNWLLQYYLRAEGLTLSWVGTGRCLSSLDFTVEDYQELQHKVVSAAQQMQRDGWWLDEAQQPGRDQLMRLRLMKEMLGSVVQMPQPLKSFYREVMRRKHDDHLASHSNKINQFFHLLSSSVFIYCYGLFIFADITRAMALGLAALFVRQFGHAILEPPCHEKEALLLGFTTPNKTLIVAGYLLLPVADFLRVGSFSLATLSSLVPAIAWQWFLWTAAVVLGRVLYLVWKHDFRSSMIWFVKLVTDPFTDIPAYLYSPIRLFSPKR